MSNRFPLLWCAVSRSRPVSLYLAFDTDTRHDVPSLCRLARGSRLCLSPVTLARAYISVQQPLSRPVRVHLYFPYYTLGDPPTIAHTFLAPFANGSRTVVLWGYLCELAPLLASAWLPLSSRSLASGFALRPSWPRENRPRIQRHAEGSRFKL